MSSAYVPNPALGKVSAAAAAAAGAAPPPAPAPAPPAPEDMIPSWVTGPVVMFVTTVLCFEYPQQFRL